MLPKWLEPRGLCPGCDHKPGFSTEARQRAALLEVREQVSIITRDLMLLCLGLACIEAEVEDALTPESVLYDGLGGGR
jgi:hypothetical protein